MDPEPPNGGYDVDETAVRLSSYLDVLGELVHLSCGHLALEPRFEVKALLGDHLHDDARAISKLRRRLYELGSDSTGAPSDELAALLDRAGDAATGEYLEIAYGELKPTLIAAIRVHLEHLDPIVDEPSLRLLTRLLHRQDRHVAELPPGRERVAFEDLGSLPRPRAVRPLKVLPPLGRPARDPFVAVTDLEPSLAAVPTDLDELEGFLHDLVHSELCTAELTARTSHEHPDMPWEFHADMARQTWDAVRHAETVDRLMATELGVHWGDRPVGMAGFEAVYALDLPGRLARLAAAAEPRAAWRESDARRALTGRGRQTLARALDYVFADAARHAEIAARWGASPRETAPTA
jgi:hypothetical protein